MFKVYQLYVYVQILTIYHTYSDTLFIHASHLIVSYVN